MNIIWGALPATGTKITMVQKPCAPIRMRSRIDIRPLLLFSTTIPDVEQLTLERLYQHMVWRVLHVFVKVSPKTKA